MSDNKPTRLEEATESGSTLCACGCGQSCKRQFVAGHNLRRGEHRPARAKQAPSPAKQMPSHAQAVTLPDEFNADIAEPFDFESDSYIGEPLPAPDIPRIVNPLLNHCGTGAEILMPHYKVGTNYFHLTRPWVKSLTSAVEFCCGVLCEEKGELILDENGHASWHVVKRGRKPEIIWEGVIRAPETYERFKVTRARELTPAPWARFVAIQIMNKGGYWRKREIANMDFEQPKSKASWIDQLDVSVSGRVNEIKNYIRCLRAELGDKGISIAGIGPVHYDGSLLFAAPSVAFGTDGKVWDDVRVNLHGLLPDAYAYYDLTPVSEITDDEIRQGCELLISAYAESPAYPEIPAAYLGQIFTAPVAVIEPKYFTALFLSGIKGSGKTRFANRYDSIQSRKLRGELSSARPVLNLGDTTGTEKGTKYRVQHYAGFAISTDDVLKADATQAQITLQSSMVSNLVRSFESGGGALGRVDYATNEIVSSESGTLLTSIRFASERPVTGDSTQDRMAMLPHINSAWKTGEVFSIDLAVKLSTPVSIELQHRAWSAYVQWLFTQIDTELEKCYVSALARTRAWGLVNARTDHYAALICGHMMFARFCAERLGMDVSATAETATEALHACAVRQSVTSVPLASVFRKRLRQWLIDGKTALPGSPLANPDGSHSSSYGDPRIRIQKTSESGVSEPEYKWPPGIGYPGQLGLIMTERGVPSPGNQAHIPYGFVVPPRTDRGGKQGSPLSRKWSVVIPAAFQDNFFTALTDYCKTRGGETFHKEDVINALVKDGLGNRVTRKVVTSPDADVRKKIKNERVLEIDCEWLFASDESEE